MLVDTNVEEHGGHSEANCLHILEGDHRVNPVRDGQHHLHATPTPSNSWQGKTGFAVCYHWQIPVVDMSMSDLSRALSLTFALCQDESELDRSQILHHHDHVVEDGDVLAMHREQSFKQDERPELCEGGDEGEVGFRAPQTGHEGGDQRCESLAEANVSTVFDPVG